jgi:hypothetical protein
MKLSKIHGSQRELGPGIMRVGFVLWKKCPAHISPSRDPEASADHEDHYAKFLIRPIEAKIEEMEEAGSKADVPLLQMMFHAVRAILYTVNVVSEELFEEQFERFMACDRVDSSALPELARMQAVMIKQGWGILCFRVLKIPEMDDLHLAVLLLLEALTGGANVDVQDLMLQQLNDPVLCGQELCASTFRTLLRSSIKNALNRSHTQSTGEIDSEFEIGHATQVLTVVSNMCAGNHSGMQEYMVRQPGYPTKLNFVEDVVDYLHTLEPSIKIAVSESKTVGSRVHTEETWGALETAFAAFHALIAMMDSKNAIVIAGTSVLSFVNRVLALCIFNFEDVSATGLKGKHKPRRRLVSLMSRFLLTLVDGVPGVDVINPMVSSIDWGTIRDFLVIFMTMTTVGRLPKGKKDLKLGADSREPDNSGEEELPEGEKDGQREPLWLKMEIFKFTTVIVKTEMTARELGVSRIEEFMEEVLIDDELQKHFYTTLGMCEIQRDDGDLERVFYLEPDIRNLEETEEEIIEMMDKVPRDHNETKLRLFIDGALQIIMMRSQEVQVADNPMIRFDNLVDAIIPGDGHEQVLFCSVCISLICIASWDHTLPDGERYSHNVELFGRMGHAKWFYTAFVIVSGVQLLNNLLMFYEFMTVRVPVLLACKTRSARVQYTLSTVMKSNQRAHKEFLDCKHTLPRLSPR